MRICLAVRSHKLAVGLVVALASTTSIAAADDTKPAPVAQNEEAALTLQLGVGINWLSLPSWGSRRPDFFGSGDTRVVDDGLNLGFNLGLPLGQIGSQPLILEWNGSISDLSSSSTDRTSLAGQNSLNMTYGSSANGSINRLAATSVGTLPAVAEAEVWGVGGTGRIYTRASSSDAVDGRITQFASNPSITGGTFTALVTNATIPSAAAYAAYTDNTGFTLAGIGDLSNSAVIDERDEDATAIDQTLLLGAPIDLQGGWTITPKFGPMYRSIDRDVDLRRTLVIGASIPGVVVPQVGVSQNDELDARYVGALAELSVMKALQPDLSVSVDARLGGAYLHSRYRSQTSAFLPNVSTGPFDFVSETRDDASLLAGVGAGLRYAPTENLQVGLDAGVNYINKVPTINYVADAGGVSPTIGMSHAIDYNVSVSVTWRF